MAFLWSSDCEQALLTLKEKLIQAPVLAYPKLGANASTFTLETDASAVGTVEVLEQDGHMLLIFCHETVRHYLLGRPFTILTDHAPLQWLSGQKMEGLLCRWALALQEYDFIIRYRKGSQNSNADALSRCHPQTEKLAAVVASGTDRNLLKLAQEHDPVFFWHYEHQTKDQHNGSSDH
ncbi:hypothetical protein EMCRGX_G012542 [Ephydatia muelleri]